MWRFLHERVAARTSVERPGEGDGQSLSQGRDRVLDVALGSDRGASGSWTTGKDRAFAALAIVANNLIPSAAAESV